MPGDSATLSTPVLLLAMPQVLDPFFHRSVVLLIRHEDEGSLGFIVNRPTGIKVTEILKGMEVDWRGREDTVAYFGGPVAPNLGTVLFGPASSATAGAAAASSGGAGGRGGGAEGGAGEGGSRAGSGGKGSGGEGGSGEGGGGEGNGGEGGGGEGGGGGGFEAEAASEVLAGVSLTQHVGDLSRLAEAPPERFRLFLGYAGWGSGQLIAEILRNDWLTAPARGDLIFAPDPDRVWSAALESVGVDPATLPSWTPGGNGQETAN